MCSYRPCTASQPAVTISNCTPKNSCPINPHCNPPRSGFYPTGQPTDPTSRAFSPSGILVKVSCW